MEENNQFDSKYVLNLVSKIVAINTQNTKSKILTGIKKILNEDLLQIVDNYAPHNFNEIHSRLLYTLEKFKDFIIFSKLIGKNTVALGGAFSSGKSSFINSLIKQKLLPAEIDPSTSVPTYVMYGDNNRAIGINIFDNELELNYDDLKNITHGFSKEYNINFGHLLETIFVETEGMPVRNISFLDTPGYSKPESGNYSQRTDEHIARNQLNSANYILWFVSAEDGTITNDDIEFIKTLNKEIPIAIIVNKCDKRKEEEVKNILGHIKETLENKGIFPVDIIPYSCRYPDKFGRKRVEDLLQGWDRENYESTFPRDFKLSFLECYDFYQEKLMEEEKRLHWVNVTLTLTDNAETISNLNFIKNDITILIQSLKQKIRKLKDMQNKFFMELKAIGDEYGIKLPEPSQMEFLDVGKINLRNVLKDYKKNNNIKDEGSYHLLLNNLSNLFDNNYTLLGTNKHKKKLVNLLKDELNKIEKENLNIVGNKKHKNIIIETITHSIREIIN